MIDFGSLPVFTDADTYAAIYTLCRTVTDHLDVVKVSHIEDANASAVRALPIIRVPFSDLDDAPWNLGHVDIVKELDRNGIRARGTITYRIDLVSIT
jgi:hypothetical protein